MKRLISIIGLVLVVAAVAAPTSSAQRPCADRVLRTTSGLESSAVERYGLQLFVWDRCGNRSGVAFG
jgi:hypothetical protein